MPRFKDAPKRKPIDRAGLVQIYARLFGGETDKLTKPVLEERIKTFGRCECESKDCKEPFQGYCEFDHYYPQAGSKEGDATEWRALTKVCHSLKTRTKDVPHLAKLKRTKAKYNPDPADEPKREKPKAQIQSRGFNTKYKKKMNGEVVLRDAS